jgi:hypothetical protein
MEVGPAAFAAELHGGSMRAHLATLGLVVLGLVSCENDPGPAPPNLRVSVSTTGADLDVDGYLVHAGDTKIRSKANGVVELLVAFGTYDVRLDGIAPNCAVQGPGSQRVTVTESRLAETAFQLQCRAVTAALEVGAPTTGRDFDRDGYMIIVDRGSASQRTATVFPNSSTTVDSLGAGSHVVSLDNLADNCGLQPGSNDVAFDAKVGGLTKYTHRIAFQVACTAVTGDVRLSTVTTGEDFDSNGYTVLADGKAVIIEDDYYGYYGYAGYPLRLGSQDSWMFPEVSASDHTYGLADIAANCSVTEANPQTVTVTVGKVSEVVFHVVCKRP